MAGVDADVTDSLVMSLADTPVRAVGASQTDTIGIAPALTSYYGLVVLERLAFSLAQVLNQIATVSLAETVAIAQTFQMAIPVGLSDTLGVNDTFAQQLALTVLESVRLSPALSVQAKLEVALAQGIGLSDALLQFYGADVSEAINVAPSLVASALYAAGLSDTIGVQLTVNPQLLLNVVAADTIGIAPGELLQMIYNGQLADGIEITGGFVSPDGDLTTWAMNAHTGAVTEYTNYDFNSFAQIGDRYLGASSSGLYELLGDTDDGVNIIPRLRSGYMQFGGTKLSRLKEAYLAARGEGNWVLKIITADGLTYNYSVANRNMRSTKVHMGKGMRARYFAFELTGDGTDFDLDTLEFVPIVVTRRV